MFNANMLKSIMLRKALAKIGGSLLCLEMLQNKHERMQLNLVHLSTSSNICKQTAQLQAADAMQMNDLEEFEERILKH